MAIWGLVLAGVGLLVVGALWGLQIGGRTLGERVVALPETLALRADRGEASRTPEAQGAAFWEVDDTWEPPAEEDDPAVGEVFDPYGGDGTD